MVVQQLAEQFVLTQEDPGLNLTIYNSFISGQLFEEKDENKEKEAGNGPFKKKIYINLCFDSFKRD